MDDPRNYELYQNSTTKDIINLQGNGFALSELELQNRRNKA